LKNSLYRALTQLEGYECGRRIFYCRITMRARCRSAKRLMEGSLDDITRRFERSVLTQLYRIYPSTASWRNALGVSHTAIANKLREYGLSQKKGEE
jgi:transcriptional regulator of aroF, aroG, tyrA and aromatic amino acid transport